MELLERNDEIAYIQKEKKIFSFLAVFMMLGNVYAFPLLPSLGMGELIFIMFMPYFLIRVKGSIVITRDSKGLLFYMIYGFLVTVVMSVFFQSSIGNIAIRLIRDFFYYLIILFLGIKLFNKETFYKWVIRFCVVLAVFVILQSLVYVVSGYFIPGFPMSAQINDGGYTGRELYAKYLSYARIAGYLRPNGFLCEPSHCAQCFFVAVVILLSNEKGLYRKQIPYAVLISIGAILTMSTSAVVYVTIAWIMWLIKEVKHNILKVVIAVFVVGIIGFIIYSRGNLTNMISVTNRLVNALTGNATTNSSEMRIQKGFTIFANLPAIFQIFGIGFGTYTSALRSSLISTNVAMVESEYMNTFSYILVSSGIVGGFIMLASIVRLFKSCGLLGRMIVIALVIMSLGSSIYSSPICVWVLLTLLSDTYFFRNNVFKQRIKA